MQLWILSCNFVKFSDFFIAFYVFIFGYVTGHSAISRNTQASHILVNCFSSKCIYVNFSSRYLFFNCFMKYEGLYSISLSDVIRHWVFIFSFIFIVLELLIALGTLCGIDLVSMSPRDFQVNKRHGQCLRIVLHHFLFLTKQKRSFPVFISYFLVEIANNISCCVPLKRNFSNKQKFN